MALVLSLDGWTLLVVTMSTIQRSILEKSRQQVVCLEQLGEEACRTLGGHPASGRSCNFCGRKRPPYLAGRQAHSGRPRTGSQASCIWSPTTNARTRESFSPKHTPTLARTTPVALFLSRSLLPHPSSSLLCSVPTPSFNLARLIVLSSIVLRCLFSGWPFFLDSKRESSSKPPTF